MDNKLIGIFGWKVTDTCYGVPTSYLQYANYFGDVKIISIHEPVDPNVDILIVPGGADVNPSRYKGIPSFFTGKTDPIKEYQDTVLLPQYIDLGIPIFGICRGIQAIAVHFGATLVQHMFHETNDDDRCDGVHELRVLIDDDDIDTEISTWRRNNHGKNFKVNSMHHQCVSHVDFPEVLEIVAVYQGKHKPAIEVIRHKTLPIYGVQYHPEELAEDPIGDAIMYKLLNYKKVYETV